MSVKITLSADQIELLARMGTELEQIEAQQAELTRLLADFNPSQLASASMDNIEAIADQLVEQLLASALASLEQLETVPVQLTDLEEHVTEQIEGFTERLDELSELPETLEARFKETEEKIAAALEDLERLIQQQLQPQWQALEAKFQSFGLESFNQFQGQLTEFKDKLQSSIRDTIRETLEKKFGALREIKAGIETFMKNSEALAEQIQDLCKVMANSQILISEQVSNANIGVESTIQALREIDQAIRQILPIH